MWGGHSSDFDFDAREPAYGRRFGLAVVNSDYTQNTVFQ
jgi:hypothetical protein